MEEEGYILLEPPPISRSQCRPSGTGSIVWGLPWTYVLGYHMPPLRGWRSLAPTSRKTGKTWGTLC